MRKCAISWLSMRKCAYSKESVLKLEKVVMQAEKVWESMRKCVKSWEVCLKYEKMC